MKYNAFKACDEVMGSVSGAPEPGDSMKSYTSESLQAMFFNDEICVKDYLHGSEEKRKTLPGANLFKQVLFAENHFEVGEKYIEFVKFSCRKSQICTTLCSFVHLTPM